MKPVAPGVFAITLPLPWELETVNVHMVELSDGWMLVDSGIGTPACFETLRQGLESHGLAWDDIRTLCLTHMHPDHVGLAGKLLGLSGAKLLMHRAEAEHLAAVVAGENRAPWFEQALAEAGVPEELKTRIRAIFGDLRRHFRALTPNWALEGGETIAYAGGTLEVVWTPGHSPGHICLYSPQHRFLISGDHILENITPNISWHPDRDALGEFLQSLDRLRPFEIDLVLPSHGTPFSGHRRRIRETADHHAGRCDQIHSLVASEPKTAHALVERMWEKRLSPFHHHFAVLEVLAHLAHMERNGRLSARRENGGPLYWAPSPTFAVLRG